MFYGPEFFWRGRTFRYVAFSLHMSSDRVHHSLCWLFITRCEPELCFIVLSNSNMTSFMFYCIYQFRHKLRWKCALLGTHLTI